MRHGLSFSQRCSQRRSDAEHKAKRFPRPQPAAIYKPQAKERQLLDDFKNFVLRGNVVDLAVGVIIGAAFGKIIDSIVGDIMMPIIGAITGGLDFSSHYIPLSKSIHSEMSYTEAKQVGAVIGYGQFITVAVNFAIIATVLFLVIKIFERLKKEKPATPPEPTKTELLLQEIRDALRGQN